MKKNQMARNLRMELEAVRRVTSEKEARLTSENARLTNDRAEQQKRIAELTAESERMKQRLQDVTAERDRIIDLVKRFTSVSIVSLSTASDSQPHMLRK